MTQFRGSPGSQSDYRLGVNFRRSAVLCSAYLGFGALPFGFGPFGA
ncbi:MAG: hypothetical protein JWP46_1542 [Modestobacter sp.]|nr:hypothetical protein [Modestobacter sp.]